MAARTSASKPEARAGAGPQRSESSISTRTSKAPSSTTSSVRPRRRHLAWSGERAIDMPRASKSVYPAAASRARSTCAWTEFRRVLTCWIARGRVRRARRAPQRLQGRSAKRPANGAAFHGWRREPESNRPQRICNPVHNRFAIAPLSKGIVPYRIRSASSDPCPQTTKGKPDGFPFDAIWSGKRVSNSRPQPWQGCALPTELFPLRACAERWVRRRRGL
jgi:hypothetical protein